MNLQINPKVQQQTTKVKLIPLYNKSKAKAFSYYDLDNP